MKKYLKIIFVSSLFLAGTVYASTTIGTGIDTGGNLRVTGISKLGSGDYQGFTGQDVLSIDNTYTSDIGSNGYGHYVNAINAFIDLKPSSVSGTAVGQAVNS